MAFLLEMLQVLEILEALEVLEILEILEILATTPFPHSGPGPPLSPPVLSTAKNLANNSGHADHVVKPDCEDLLNILEKH